MQVKIWASSTDICAKTTFKSERQTFDILLKDLAEVKHVCTGSNSGPLRNATFNLIKKAFLRTLVCVCVSVDRFHQHDSITTAQE